MSAPRYFPPLDYEMTTLQNAAVQTDATRRYSDPIYIPHAEVAAALARTYPWLEAGAVSSLAQAQQGPATPTAQAVAQASASQKAKHSGWFHPGEWVKDITRPATAVLSAPYELVQSKFRTGYGEVAGHDSTDVSWWRRALGVAAGVKSVADPFDSATQRQVVRKASENKTNKQIFDETSGLQNTTAGFAARSLASGNWTDLGHGWFGFGGANANEAAFARTQAQINGHAVTLGRATAAQVTEPGTRQYGVLSGLVDAASAWYADPLGKPLGAVSKARRVNDTLRSGRVLAADASTADVANLWRDGQLLNAGAVPGVRRTVLPEEAAMWLNSAPGRAVVQKMAATSDFNTLWHATGKKVPVEVIAQIAAEKDPERVAALLGEQLGTTIRENPQLKSVAVRNITRGWRWTNGMPGSTVPVDDPNAAVETIDRYQRNAKMPEATISANNAKVALAKTPTDLLAVTTDVARQAHQHLLTSAGLSQQSARKLTTLWKDYNAGFRKYFVDEIGENKPLPWTTIDETGKALPDPHLWSELINSGIPLSDARAIRRATSGLGRLIDKPLSRPVRTSEGIKWLQTDVRPLATAVALNDFITQHVFKTLVLARAAWPIRVIGEEQVRMSASGLDSMFAHPLSWLAWRSAVKTPTDATGHLLGMDEDFQMAMAKGSANFRDPQGMIRTNADAVFTKENPAFHRAWADEIATLANDPVARSVAEGMTARTAKVINAETGALSVPDAQRAVPLGRPALETPNTAGWEGASDWFWSGAGQKMRKTLAQVKGAEKMAYDRRAADAYLRTVFDRIQIKTGGHPDLVDAVATGRLKGVKIANSSGITNGTFRSALHAYADSAPKAVKGDFLVHGKGGLSQVAATYDKAVEAIFNSLMSARTNSLSRSPAFKQFYWQRMGEIAGSITREDAAKMLKAAEGNKLPTDIMDLLRSGAQHAEGTHSLNELDLIAKGHALDNTRKLLYDLHERSQFADIFRNIFPFAEAWKEVLTRWASITAQNPQVLRRAQQIVQGAEGAGFFYTDENGQERFSYPGSAWLTKQVTGVPVGLSGTAAGLNIFSSSVLPGAGPQVQILAAHLLPDTPTYDSLRSQIIPFGAPDTGGGLVETFFPSWLQQGLSALGHNPSPEQQRKYANTVMDLASAMLTTGKYDNSTEKGQAKLLHDAKQNAKLLMLMGSAARFAAPSAPRFDYNAKDPRGNWVAANLLASDLHDMQDKLGYDEATHAFITKYGPNAMLYLQAHTRQVIQGVEPTKEAYDWGRQHSEFRNSHPLVYGWFAPSGGEFDFAAYRDMLDRKETVPITPEQQLRLANSRVASLIYYTARANLGANPTKEQRIALHDFQDSLRLKYPGYQDNSGLAERADTPTVIQALEQATRDPAVKDSPQGQALALYFTARASAVRAARKQGLTDFTTAKSAQPIRDWLDSFGTTLAAQSPDFARVWERLLSREVDG